MFIFCVEHGCICPKMVPIGARAAVTMGSHDGHRGRMRMRFARNGLAGFLDHEIVELLLTFCIPRRDVKSQAHALIDRFGSLAAVLDADRDLLELVNGVGVNTALFLTLFRSVANVYLEQKSISSDGSRAPTIDDWAKVWVLRLGGEVVEHMEVAFLDSGRKPQHSAVERLTSGYSDSVTAVPRELLTAVLRRNCSAVILCHNHPNGSLLPSEHDERFTRAVDVHLHTLGVQLFDHIIVGGTKAFSIFEQRELNTKTPAVEQPISKNTGRQKRRLPPNEFR